MKPQQHSFELLACREYIKQVGFTIVKTYSPVQLASTYLICYSKTVLKIQATIHPSKTNFLGIFSYKQVLNFKKLNPVEKNLQTKNHAKRRKSVNKQKFQEQVVINNCNNILFYIQLLASAMFRTVRRKIDYGNNFQDLPLVRSTWYVLEISQGSSQSN